MFTTVWDMFLSLAEQPTTLSLTKLYATVHVTNPPALRMMRLTPGLPVTTKLNDVANVCLFFRDVCSRVLMKNSIR